MTRIVFVITGLSVGGAEMMLLKLLSQLDRSRFSPYVISLTTEGEIGSRLAELNIPVFVLNMHSAKSRTVCLFKMVKIIKRLNPSVVQTWMYHADLVGGIAARLAGVEHIVWCIRNSNLSKTATKLTTLMVVKLCAYCSRWLPEQIISCSRRAMDIHVEVGYAVSKMLVIPNGFDLHCFGPNPAARESVRQEIGVDACTPLVGLIGRFDPQKNHLGFVEAAKVVHQERPDAHFLLAGRNVDQSNRVLRGAINSAGLNDNCHLMGLRDDVPRLMAALDVLLLSSSGEAFPNVIGEAMACEVPCVVTDVGDSAYIVGETGRVVASGDMVSLADNVMGLLSMGSDELASLGRSARIRVANLFEINSVVHCYEDFYDKLIGD